MHTVRARPVNGRAKACGVCADLMLIHHRYLKPVFTKTEDDWGTDSCSSIVATVLSCVNGQPEPRKPTSYVRYRSGGSSGGGSGGGGGVRAGSGGRGRDGSGGNVSDANSSSSDSSEMLDDWGKWMKAVCHRTLLTNAD